MTIWRWNVNKLQWVRVAVDNGQPSAPLVPGEITPDTVPFSGKYWCVIECMKIIYLRGMPIEE